MTTLIPGEFLNYFIRWDYIYPPCPLIWLGRTGRHMAAKYRGQGYIVGNILAQYGITPLMCVPDKGILYLESGDVISRPSYYSKVYREGNAVIEEFFDKERTIHRYELKARTKKSFKIIEDPFAERLWDFYRLYGNKIDNFFYNHRLLLSGAPLRYFPNKIDRNPKTYFEEIEYLIERVPEEIRVLWVRNLVSLLPEMTKKGGGWDELADLIAFRFL